ncbi:putative 3-alpha-(or 20-beta)-hydroxysteroid dehydrogenase protein [Botrytis fragariae]|uniref:Short-chain dehydrogenase/reductase ABA4 n=1 Tax=Botrytis fragariae TaxID=1964551 RepID=A0A8H6EIG8_9HELO|nr:putative 3-alpha-(or 20-beta)-hydroxysteroid dehydrogenase protein [Botrytis fragariae]KAF5873453.1 putative 3-alpha-(or 20-beta)-hydroxysteroid dehydrogenase protein [Botrytis fragariae]
MSMKGKIIAITGGASGIGLATAKVLSSRGAIVCIGDISNASLETAMEGGFPSQVKGSIVDVSNRKSVEGWIDEIVNEFGKLDGAANCAGVIGKHHGVRKIQDLEDEEWDKIIAVNLTGMMYSLRAELSKIENGGSIVNVSSIAGTHGPYVASKHGVIGLTRTAALEVGDRNVRVNALAPGPIDTPMMGKARETHVQEGEYNSIVLKRLGTAEEMAAIIAFLLSEESSFVTGAVYHGAGGMSA